MTPVPRVPVPAREEFQREWEETCLPVVLLGAMDGWRARRSWTPELLARVAGDIEVDVAVSRDGISSAVPDEDGSGPDVERMTIAALVSRIRATNAEGLRYSLLQQTLTRTFRLLAADLQLPPLLPRPKLLTSHLWLGSSGVVTPLHFDLPQNFLGQIHGRKRVTLFSPEDTPRLYPVDSGRERNPNRSRVNLDRPDLERYPDFARAAPLVVDLEPGDLLYLPPCWWHHVKALDVSISVNFWYRPRLGQCLGENGRSLLRGERARGRDVTLVLDPGSLGARPQDTLDAALGPVHHGGPA